jgi:hypothetical protein
LTNALVMVNDSESQHNAVGPRGTGGIGRRA